MSEQMVHVTVDETVKKYVQIIKKEAGGGDSDDALEEEEAPWPCQHCFKSFCTSRALTNHIKSQHMSLLESGEAVIPHVDDKAALATTLSDQLKRMGDNGNIKFVPRSFPTDDPMSQVEPNSLIKLVSEDVSYIIIKTQGNKKLEVSIKQATSKTSKRAKAKKSENSDADEPEPSPGKKARREAQPRASPRKRPPVEISGPFECLQPSRYLPQGICHQVFFNCCEYSRHFREEHTKRRKAALRCQVCEKRLDVTPLAAGGQEVVYTCAPCNIVFTSQADQDEHERSMHAKVRPFQCRICQKRFTQTVELDEHERSIHDTVRPYECSVCQKRFTQTGGLQQHMRTHTGDRPFKCSICHKSFTQTGGLQQHMRMHTGDRPFQCTICRKSFTQLGGLQQHMRMHTGVRPFPCTYCDKAFTQKAGLDQHLRTHTKIKPFRCVVCDKSFSQTVHLRQHMRTHTNITPFECSSCGRRFKQTSHLNFHLKSHQADGIHPPIDADGGGEADEPEYADEGAHEGDEGPGEGDEGAEVMLEPEIHLGASETIITSKTD